MLLPRRGFSQRSGFFFFFQGSVVMADEPWVLDWEAPARDATTATTSAHDGGRASLLARHSRGNLPPRHPPAASKSATVEAERPLDTAASENAEEQSFSSSRGGKPLSEEKNALTGGPKGEDFVWIPGTMSTTDMDEVNKLANERQSVMSLRPNETLAEDPEVIASAPTAGDWVETTELRRLCMKEARKVRDYRILVLYLIFVVFLCFVLFFNRVSFSSEDSNYFVADGSESLVLADEYLRIADWPSYFVWLKRAYAQASSITLGSPTSPIGMVLVRQLRSSTEECKLSSKTQLLFQSQVRGGPKKCSDGGLSGTAFPPNLQYFRANRDRSDAVYAQDVPGYAVDLARPQLQFEQHLYFYVHANFTSDIGLTSDEYAAYVNRSINTSSSTLTQATTSSPTAGMGMNASTAFLSSTTTNAPLPTAKSLTDKELYIGLTNVTYRIDFLEQNGYLDSDTLIIGTDFLMYHPPRKVFSVITLIAEQMPSGVIRTAVFTEVFKSQVLGGDVANTSFASDLFVFLFILFLLFDICRDTHRRYTFDRRRGPLRALLSVNTFLHLLVVACLCFAFTYRMIALDVISSLSFDSTRSHDVHVREMMGSISISSSRSLVAYQVLSICLLPILIRIILYFSSISGLNLVTETVRVAFSDLFGVMCVSFVLISFYAITGSILFGGTSMKFRTLTSSFSTLTRDLIAADTDNFDLLAERHPRIATLYYSGFFLGLWLLILNLVLGIIVSSVVTAKEIAAQSVADSFSDVLIKFVVPFGDHYCRDVHAKRHVSAMSSSCAAVSVALRAPLPMIKRVSVWRQIYEERCEAVNAMNDFGHDVFYRRDLSFLHCLDLAVRTTLFNTALALRNSRRPSTETVLDHEADMQQSVEDIKNEIERLGLILSQGNRLIGAGGASEGATAATLSSSLRDLSPAGQRLGLTRTKRFAVRGSNK